MSGIVNSTGAVSGIVGSGGLTNMIAYRASGTSTLSGFTEYTSCRGRMIVGLQSGGADAGTVGTALTTAQDKTHTHTGPGHTHTGPSHSHTGPNHRHVTSMIVGLASGNSELGWTDAFGENGSNAAGNYHGTNDSFSGTGYGYEYTDYEGTGGTGSSGTGATNSSGTGNTGTGSTSDVLAYIQLMTIKKD